MKKKIGFDIFIIAVTTLYCTSVLADSVAITVERNSTDTECRVFHRTVGTEYNFDGPVVIIPPAPDNIKVTVMVTLPEGEIFYLAAKNYRNSGDGGFLSNEATNNPDLIPTILGIKRIK